MPRTQTLKIALELHDLTRDPLLFVAVRALTTPETPKIIADSAENYVLAQHVAYSQLFHNTDTPPHGTPRPADSD